MAIAMISMKDRSYEPETWGYIVHYGMFPEPRGKYFDKVLVPPKNLFAKNNQWGRVMLQPAEVSVKYAAIKDYSSQISLLGRFLPSFARRNELYESLPLKVLSHNSSDTLPAFAGDVDENIDTGAPGTANEEFPVKGSMFMGWQTVRFDKTLRLGLVVNRDLLPGLECTLYLKLPNGETDRMVLKPDRLLISARELWAQVDLAALGNPSVVAFAAEIRQGGVLLSKTGWHVLILD
jgi:hypothetical protein